jgi:hypothetical protein
VLWDDLDVELERGNRDFERRMEERGGEICERLEAAERCFKEAEEPRRLAWEKFEGRMMTAAEKHQFELDGIRRVSAQMTDEYVKVIRAAGNDMQRRFAQVEAQIDENRAEARAGARAQTEALMKMLDRLPPD